MNINFDVDAGDIKALWSFANLLRNISGKNALSDKIEKAIRATIDAANEAVMKLPPYDFDATVERFRNGELKVEQWNWCISRHDGKFDAYIMGEGAEQCLAVKRGFATAQEIKDLYASLGVKKHILPI